MKRGDREKQIENSYINCLKMHKVISEKKLGEVTLYNRASVILTQNLDSNLESM